MQLEAKAVPEFKEEDNVLHLLGTECILPEVFADFWRKGTLCDVEIRVADSSFRAHRVVLAASSDYMRARFCIGMADSHEQSIDLPEMPAAAFEAVLDHMYTGKCCIHTEMLVPLLEAASRLQYLRLLEVASRAAEETLSPSNGLRIWEVADQLALTKLLSASKFMCMGNFEDIAMSSEFLFLSAERLLLLLGEDELHIDREEVVFEALRRWRLAQDVVAPETWTALLSKVRFPIMPRGYVLQVRNDPLMQTPEATKALLDAMQDGNYRLDTSQNRPRRRLKFDSSRVVGNSIEFLSNGAEVRSLRDARSFAVASQPLSAENGTFYACLTWYTGSIVYIGVATSPDSLNSWQAWVWNPSHPQFCRHRGGNMERSTNFGSEKVAQGDVIGVLRQGQNLIFIHNGELVHRSKESSSHVMASDLEDEVFPCLGFWASNVQWEVTTFTASVSACAHSLQKNVATTLLAEMQRKALRPNAVIYAVYAELSGPDFFGCLADEATNSLKGTWKGADADASGLLSFTEMSMVLREGNPDLTDKELAVLFREIDTNGDLTVDFKEFARYLNSGSDKSKLQKAKSKEQLTAERCKEEFRRADENSDGKLSREEIATLLRKGNPDMGEQELQLLFKSLDQDGSGQLDFNEFVDYITGSRPEPVEEAIPTPWAGMPVPQAFVERTSIEKAEWRGIFRSQLDDLIVFIKEVLDKAPVQGGERLSWGMVDMYRATEMFVKPLTRSFRCSFAELVATEPQEGDLWDGPSSLRAMDPGEVPKWFVSHWWGTPLMQTAAMLKYHGDQRQAKKPAAMWLDAFALCLHDPEQLFPVPSVMEAAPFLKVLISPKCIGTVFLMDGTGVATGRSWCLLELALSLDMSKDKSTTHFVDIVAWNAQLKKAALLADSGNGDSAEVLDEGGAAFPLDLYIGGYKVAAHKAESRLDIDRKRILHFFASTPEDRWDKVLPPNDSKAYAAVNARLQHRFIAGAFAAAAIKDDDKMLKKMASEHPSFKESCTAYGFHPLHVAAMKGSHEALKVLVDLNCEVDATASDGRTPLFLAAREGHDTTVTQLLKAKADVNKAIGSKSALHASIEGGHITISGNLLDHKANPDSGTGETPLQLAARHDQAAMCGLLLDFKADPLKESPDGRKPFELVRKSEKLADTLKQAALQAHAGQMHKRRPSVHEARMVRDLSQFCSKEVKDSRRK
ncbi:unnamed protein product [Effrenium voratum]|uniref:Uncharacterized protein n=1 Tax=Effrenium voratum TaxID=2562239 RepID=A0AA36NAT3_9DINO|nr:unnamed protein product [Effrenium voratum]